MSISTGHIVRRRGDTLPVQVCVKDLVGAIEDIDNSTFTLTVGTEPYPATLGTSIFDVDGVINGPSTDGLVDFAIEGGDELHVGFYYFDVEMIDSTGITDTILYGWYEVKQDKTKTDEEFEWTPPTAPTDGSTAVMDGSEAILAGSTYGTGIVFTYETRDGRRVIRNMMIPDQWYYWIGFGFFGPEIPRTVFSLFGWEMRITAYINRAYFDLVLSDPTGVWNSGRVEMNTKDNVFDLLFSGGIIDAATSENIAFTWTPPDTSGWSTADWFVLGWRIDADGYPWILIKPESEADNWQKVCSSPWPEIAMPIGFYSKQVRDHPEAAESVVDFWKYEWRRLS